MALNLYSIFLEEEKKLLNENLGREMSKARRELRNAGYSDDETKKLVEKWETKPCFRKSNGKFMQGYARMFANHELTSDNTKTIENIIDLINKKYQDKFTRNLESTSDGHKWNASELMQRFYKEMAYELEDEIQNGANKGITVSSNYDFVRIPTFSKASEYGQYTSWCVTHAASNYNGYTDDGEGIFIFCLKKGFESVPREKTEGNPMDEYGVSMIAISVDKNGELNTCTCRWNHDCGAGDQMMNRSEIEDFFGVNFAETFYPRTEDEAFEDEDDEEMDYETAEELASDDAIYLDEGNIRFSQSVDDIQMRGELQQEGLPAYGITRVEGDFISDFEYQKSALIEYSSDYAILRGVSGEPFMDLYVFNNSEDDHLKNVYTYDDYEEYGCIAGSYLNNGKYYFFCVNRDDISIWDGKDRYGREAVMDNLVSFIFLENMSEEGSSDYQQELYWLIKHSDGTQTIVKPTDNLIVCSHVNLKTPEGMEDISEFMPFEDEEGEWYLETEDGRRIDPITGEITSIAHNDDEVHLLKDYGTFQTYIFKGRNQWQELPEIKMDILYNGKWVFESMGIKVNPKTFFKIEPMFGHFACLSRIARGGYVGHSRSDCTVIDLKKCEKVFSGLSSCLFTNASQWGYAEYPHGTQRIIFDGECNLLFPKIASSYNMTPAQYTIVAFENEPTKGYVLNWKKSIWDDTDAPIPSIINKDRPFDLDRKAHADQNKITGFDSNGIKIEYISGSDSIQELQTEQYRRKFNEIFGKLNKR